MGKRAKRDCLGASSQRDAGVIDDFYNLLHVPHYNFSSVEEIFKMDSWFNLYIICDAITVS